MTHEAVSHSGNAPTARQLFGDPELVIGTQGDYGQQLGDYYAIPLPPDARPFHEAAVALLNPARFARAGAYEQLPDNTRQAWVDAIKSAELLVQIAAEDGAADQFDWHPRETKIDVLQRLVAADKIKASDNGPVGKFMSDVSRLFETTASAVPVSDEIAYDYAATVYECGRVLARTVQHDSQL